MNAQVNIPEGYWLDPKGNLVPDANVKEIDKLRDQTVRRIWALAEALLANPHGLSRLRTARQGSRSFIQKLHERFMQGRRADLLIVDDVASSTEAAKLPIENNMSNEAEHSPAPAKPRTQPCYVCDTDSPSPCHRISVAEKVKPQK